MRLLATVLASILLAASAFAQTPGNCQPGIAQADINVGDVQARLFNTGSLFFGNTTVDGSGYLVPKGSSKSPIFASGLWVGGFVGGDLRVAGATYDDFEFWPGPLNDGATLPDPNDCSAFDRIWTVSVFDLEQFEETGVATDDLAEWPVELGAPFTDANGDGEYDLDAGDRPLVYGHQVAFWVMNDVGNDHFSSLTAPIGLEVRVTAFTSGELALDRYTFYRYELVNRNPVPFEDAIFAFFSDPDLGDPGDDYVGTDSTRGLAFVYNADNMDDGGFNGGYGTPPPALGLDLLSGAERSMYFQNSFPPTGDPDDGVGRYSFMQGTWGDGTPLTEGGDGYLTGGPVLRWAFPGDPATEQFWSEVNIDGNGGDNFASDRRHLISSETFTLDPGEAQTFDVGILFAQGADYLDSVTELKSVSDDVQARYDDGDLFAPSPPPPDPGDLETPELLAPEDGATFVDEVALLTWEAVPGAESYRIEIARDPDFADLDVFYSSETSFAFSGALNEVVTYYWRVQATARGLLTSFDSDVRSFTLYRYGFDSFAFGTGIIETAYPGADPCPAPDDPGCAAGYPGNTVWQNPSSTDDYVVTNPDNSFSALLLYPEVIEGDNFEMRFTDACAPAGACLGVYASAAPNGGTGSNNDLITSVPFELWNTGTEDDLEDDVRMIPILRFNAGTTPTATWVDTFPATQEVIVGGNFLTLPVTQRVLWMMPDREGGYALFEAAANGFGGPGAIYDPENDGDDQVDIYTDPATGEVRECRSQSYYVDFCYRDAGGGRFVAPIGGLAGMVLADLAGDATTPPAGTVIRFDANERLLTDSEDDAPAQPAGFALGAAYPNPFRSAATVPFEASAPGRVRLSVFDVLGREVAVLAEGDLPAGAHRAQFDGSRLASGVYLVVLEAGGQRQATKIVLLR